MSAETRHVILLDGSHLSRQQVAQIARGDALIGLAPEQLKCVQRTADFLAEQVQRGEPIYGVTTGFGSNADKLLGAHRARDELPGGNPERRDGSLMEELQHNLVITHAVCVGKPLAPEVVRAMLAIRVNTLLRGHSGIRASTLQALAELLNRDVIPVIPEKGSVGASGDLAPLSHLAIVLLGGGEAFYKGERISGGDALKRAGLVPVRLSFKEGLALNNGTTQMLATAVLALDRLEKLLATADLAAAMTLDAFAGRTSAFKAEVHALASASGAGRNRGEFALSAGRLDPGRHSLSSGAALQDLARGIVELIRRTRQQRFDIGWDYVPPAQRHGKRNILRTLPAVQGRQETPATGFVQFALYSTSTRCRARRVDAGATRDRR